MLDYPFDRETGMTVPYPQCRYRTGFGMDLEGAPAVGGTCKGMHKNVVGCSQQSRADVIVGSSAFQGNGFSFLYIAGGTVDVRLS